MELNFLIFEKYSDIKSRGNPSGGKRVVPRGRTHRHDEVNGRTSKFCERVYTVYNDVHQHV